MRTIASRTVHSGTLVRRRPPTLREFAERRNLVLINREIGGLGDILMHRMMFEDIKRTAPEVRVHFACPSVYHPAVSDHPFLDAVLDCAQVDARDYIAAYNTTTACGRHEMKVAPLSDLHRSDIWSKHCGFDLERHEMHFRFTPEETRFGREVVDGVRKGSRGPAVAFCPTSAMAGKDLVGAQVTAVLRGLIDLGANPFGLHTRPIPEVVRSRLPMVHGLSIREWMAVMSAADCAITVDTSAFHLAGGLKKPLVGVFPFTDGKVYGKYFDFVLVQKHRDDGNWECGPCYNWTSCPKSRLGRKPCITEITPGDILSGFAELLRKKPHLAN